MSSSYALPLHCCIFYDTNAARVLPPRFIRYLRQNEAMLLSSETFAEKLDLCADHTGIIVTTSIPDLITLLQGFGNIYLPLDKLHILVLDTTHDPSQRAFPLQQLHFIAADELKVLHQLPAFKRKIKQLIKGIARALHSQIKAQKRTQKQVDLSFVQALEACVHARYADPNFKSHHLAKALDISISTLERKCQKTLGTLPNQLLMTHRLTKAKELVVQSRLDMAKIAAQTGFASASYFTVKFNEYFGATPSQMRNKRAKIAS